MNAYNQIRKYCQFREIYIICGIEPSPDLQPQNCQTFPKYSVVLTSFTLITVARPLRILTAFRYSIGYNLISLIYDASLKIVARIRIYFNIFA